MNRTHSLLILLFVGLFTTPMSAWTQETLTEDGIKTELELPEARNVVFYSFYRPDSRYSHWIDQKGKFKTTIHRNNLTRAIHFGAVLEESAIYLSWRIEDDSGHKRFRFSNRIETIAAHEIVRFLGEAGYLVNFEIDPRREVAEEAQEAIFGNGFMDVFTPYQMKKNGPPVIRIIAGKPNKELLREMGFGKPYFRPAETFLMSPFLSQEESVPLETLVAKLIERGFTGYASAESRKTDEQLIRDLINSKWVPRSAIVGPSEWSPNKNRHKAWLTESQEERPTLPKRDSLHWIDTRPLTGDFHPDFAALEITGVSDTYLIGGATKVTDQLLKSLFREIDRRGDFHIMVDRKKHTKEHIDLAFRIQINTVSEQPRISGVWLKAVHGGEMIPIEALIDTILKERYRPLPVDGYELTEKKLEQAKVNALAIKKAIDTHLQFPASPRKILLRDKSSISPSSSSREYLPHKKTQRKWGFGRPTQKSYPKASFSFF